MNEQLKHEKLKEVREYVDNTKAMSRAQLALEDDPTIEALAVYAYDYMRHAAELLSELGVKPDKYE